MDKTENLNKNNKNIFHCRNCFNTPLLGIKYTSENILIQECCKCNHKYVTNLEEFYNNYKNYKINCIRCKNEIDSLNYNFCLTCINYYCDKCLKFHNYNNPIHKIIKESDNINICTKHNQSFYAYCLDCPIPLCLYLSLTLISHKTAKSSLFSNIIQLLVLVAIVHPAIILLSSLYAAKNFQFFKSNNSFHLEVLVQGSLHIRVILRLCIIPIVHL